MLTLDRYREHMGRHTLLARQLAGNEDPTRYWPVLARAVDDPERPLRIAVTAGESQNPDQWLLYPLLGRDLQNELRYVSITPGPEIVPMGPRSPRRFRADYALWHARLHEQGITHVVSFMPLSIEQHWMQQHPEHFERLEGSLLHWGLFRVRTGPD